MKKLLISLTVVLSQLICACSSSNSNTDKTQEFIIDNILSNNEPITLLDLKANMKFIKLELKDSTFIPEINKVVCADSAIYVLSYNPIKILKFDNNGKFLAQISAQGRGEGEYTFANDLFLNNDASRIYISDMTGSILEFDNNGNFIIKNSCRQGMGSYIIGSDGNIYESIQVLMGNEQAKLIVRSINNDTIAVIPNNVKYKFTPQSSASYNDSKSLFTLNGDIVYHQMSTDTIYTYSPEDKALKIRYYFTNPYPITAKVYEQLANKANELTLVYDIAEDNNYIYATIITPPWKKQLYLIDKATKKYYKADFEIGKELGQPSESILFYPKWQHGNKLIDYIDKGEGEPVIAILEFN